MSTRPPCPIPTCSHLSRVRAQTIPFVIPGSFSQVMPEATCGLIWSLHPTAPLSCRLPLPWHLDTLSCNRSGPALLHHGLRAPNSEEPDPKPQPRAWRGHAGNGGCTAKHRSCHKQRGWDVCSSNPISERIWAPGASQAELGEEGQRGTRCRWHSKDRMQSTSTQHLADPTATQAAKPTASMLRMQLRKGKSLSGKTRGQLMLSPSQGDRITQRSKCHRGLNSQPRSSRATSVALEPFELRHNKSLPAPASSEGQHDNTRLLHPHTVLMILSALHTEFHIVHIHF